MRHTGKELLDIVTPCGTVTGTANRSTVHNGAMLRHPTVHLLLFSDHNRLLLQLRTPGRSCCPSLWDSSVSGHVRSREYLIDALIRECREELGIALPAIEPLAAMEIRTSTELELAYFFTGRLGSNIPHPDPSEIAELAFFLPDRLRKLAPAMTPSLQEVLPIILRRQKQLLADR